MVSQDYDMDTMDPRDWAVIGSAFVAAGSLALSYSELSRTSRAEKRCERIQKIAAAAPKATRAHLEHIAETASAEVVTRYWFKTRPAFYPLNLAIILVFVGLGVVLSIRFRAYGGDVRTLIVGLCLCAVLAGQSIIRLARRERDLNTATMLVLAGVGSPDDVRVLSYEERGYEAAATREVPKRVQRFQARVDRSLQTRAYFTVEEVKRQRKRAEKRSRKQARIDQRDVSVTDTEPGADGRD